MSGLSSVMETLSSENVVIFFMLINAILVLILILAYFKSRSTLKRIYSKFGKLFDDIDEKNVQKLLEECISNDEVFTEKNAELERKIESIDKILLQSIQKVGVVRFNAFDNVGSDLSFAVALLDSHDTGIVLSGIFSRESSFTYAKPVVNGNSKHTLSAEEIQAINISKKNYSEKVFIEN